MVGQYLPQTNEKVLQCATVTDVTFSPTFSPHLNTAQVHKDFRHKAKLSELVPAT